MSLVFVEAASIVNSNFIGSIIAQLTGANQRQIFDRIRNFRIWPICATTGLINQRTNKAEPTVHNLLEENTI